MLSEKQRKRIVEAIQNPKNSKKTLKTILENSDFNSEFDLSQFYRDLSDDEIKLEDRMNALYANISERLYGELKQLPPEKMAELAEKWDIKGGLDKTGYLDPMFETDVLMISAGGNEAIWDAIAQLYREGYLTPPEKLEARKIRNSLRKSLRYQGALCIDNVARLKESGCNLSENKKFDYREYIQDNWLLKEAKGQPATASDLKGFATKDSTLNREKRAKEGNWRGSIGKYVEAHGAEINAAASSHQLRNFVVNTMKPALGPEAQEYLDNLLANCKSDSRLLQALYNVTLKGSGMGLHEEVGEKGSAVKNLNDSVEEFWEDHYEGKSEDLNVTADEIVQLSETAVEDYRDESDEDFEEDMCIVFSDESYFAGEELTLWGAGPGGEEVTLSFAGEDIAVTDEMSKKVLTLLKQALNKGWYSVE